MGEAPRAYIEKIKPPTDEQMNDDATAALNLMALSSSNSAAAGRMGIAERFEKI